MNLQIGVRDAVYRKNVVLEGIPEDGPNLLSWNWLDAGSTESVEVVVGLCPRHDAFWLK